MAESCPAGPGAYRYRKMLLDLYANANDDVTRNEVRALIDESYKAHVKKLKKPLLFRIARRAHHMVPAPVLLLIRLIRKN